MSTSRRTGAAARPHGTISGPVLQEMKRNQERIAALTAYDASFAHLFDAAGVDVLLVGDSLGMAVQGHPNTLPVDMDAMVYHCRAVRRGSHRALLVGDLPFGSYPGPAEAYRNGARLMAEGGMAMVKLEGAGPVLDSIRYLSERGIPVCAHLGLTPQSVHAFGGFKVQGVRAESAQRLRDAAQDVAAAGATLLVLECVPGKLAREITASVPIPTIGIGAGPDCDGQILVCYDMLGVTAGRRPKFSKDFLAGKDSIADAVAGYVDAVKRGQFPAAAHTF